MLILVDRHKLAVPLDDTSEDKEIVALERIEDEIQAEGVALAVSDNDAVELWLGASVILEEALLDAKLCEAFDVGLPLDDRHSDADELNDADTDAQAVEHRVPVRVADTLDETLNE